MQPHSYGKGKNCRGCRSCTTKSNGMLWCCKYNFNIQSTNKGDCRGYKPKYKKTKKVKKVVYASKEEELKVKGWIKKDGRKEIL